MYSYYNLNTKNINSVFADLNFRAEEIRCYWDYYGVRVYNLNEENIQEDQQQVPVIDWAMQYFILFTDVYSISKHEVIPEVFAT